MSEKTTALYGRTSDGFLAARVGNKPFALLSQSEGFRLAKAWVLTQSVEEGSAADFDHNGSEPVDEAGFRERVEEWALHQRQLAALGRQSVMQQAWTPWGLSQQAVLYAPGIVAYSTAGHGGFGLTPDRNAEVLTLPRTEDGFYEEDCAWAAVTIAFPDLFTDFEHRHADQTLKHAFPDAWEAVHGNPLEAGQSRPKDRRTFADENANRWAVTSAILSSERPGFVECIATVGGRRAVPGTRGDNDPAERRYLVHEDRYDIGQLGFVIDESVDELYHGPSSFIGWSGR